MGGARAWTCAWLTRSNARAAGWVTHPHRTWGEWGAERRERYVVTTNTEQDVSGTQGAVSRPLW